MILKHNTEKGTWIYEEAESISVKSITTEFLDTFREGGEKRREYDNTKCGPDDLPGMELRYTNSIHEAVEKALYQEAGYTGEHISFRQFEPDLLKLTTLTLAVLTREGKCDKCIAFGSGPHRTNQLVFILNDNGKTVERVYA